MHQQQRLNADQIDRARKTDLLAYLLKYEPGALERVGADTWRHKEHDSLICHCGRWFWNSRGRPINAVDYLMDIRGKSFSEAVKLLTEDAQLPSRFQPPPQQKKAFVLPPAVKCSPVLYSYLRHRGISADVIYHAQRQGILYETIRNGEAYCVFVGRDDAGTPRFASIRSCTGNRRYDVAGSDKQYGFCYPPENAHSRHLAVFEAPIDALSHATLQQMEGWKWDGYRLALGGTAPRALLSFLERNPEIRRVALYLDNDLAGQKNARKIKTLLRADPRFRRIHVSINPPHSGKDYNEMLQNRIEKFTRPPPQRTAGISL